MKTDLNEYNKKIRTDLLISSVQNDKPFQFNTTWGLFSPRAIDEGSQMLLNYLEIKPQDDCLDLGCGYGVLGICMAALANEGKTTLVDKDFVAIDYSVKNLKANNITNAECFLSNGFDQIDDRKFDVIVSNIPAKVGKEMLYMYMFDAHKHLKTGGDFYIVTITGLRQFFKRGFQEVFGNYKKIKQGKTYTVAKATKQ
ncbi:MAG: methyltransferase [Gammaproteobacteria bacterium]|nr:methyltransferase [Gammaproteobacteria bacterium]